MKANAEKAQPDGIARRPLAAEQQKGQPGTPIVDLNGARRREAPLDGRTILALQAGAGNAAVARLITHQQQARQPPKAPPAPTPRSAHLGAEGLTLQAQQPGARGQTDPSPAITAAGRHAALDKLRKDSDADSLKIRQVLTGNTYLGSANQAEIMAVVHKWAPMPSPPGSSMSGMDWLIAGLHRNTYQVGVLVKQSTSAFDEMHRRMSADNVAEFQRLIASAGKQFKNDKPIEHVKFEVSQEDIIRGLKAGGELAAAVATGGGSMLLQVGYWLASTLPDLWQKARAIFGLIDSIRSFRSADLASKFTPVGLGDLVVRAMFEQPPGLPVIAGQEPPNADEGGESSGLVKVLHTIVRAVSVVKSAYNKIAHTVNPVLGSLNISNQPWLQPLAMAYAGIVETLEKFSNPGAALHELADKVHASVGGFFGTIKGGFSAAIAGVKDKLSFVLEPVKLLEAVAEKAVVTVLNFIITHPPSEILRTVFSVIQTAANKELIEVVRDKLKPMGDELIQKIAHSDVVQGVIKHLDGPVHMITDGLDGVTQKGLQLVGETESKLAEFLSAEKLAELAELGPSAAAPASVAAADDSADFLTVVKRGLHSHLLAIGTAGLAGVVGKGKDYLKGKAGAAKAWVGGKTAAGKQWVKGQAAQVAGFFSVKKPFSVNGEKHSLYSTDSSGSLAVASDPPPTNLAKHPDQKVRDAYQEYLRDIAKAKTPPEKETAAMEPLKKILAALRKWFKDTKSKDPHASAPGVGNIAPFGNQLSSLRGTKDKPVGIPLWGMEAEHLLPRSWQDVVYKALHQEGIDRTAEYNAQPAILIYQGAAEEKTDASNGDNAVMRVIENKEMPRLLTNFEAEKKSSPPSRHMEILAGLFDLAMSMLDGYAEDAISRTVLAIKHENAMKTGGSSKTNGARRGHKKPELPTPDEGRVRDAYRQQREMVHLQIKRRLHFTRAAGIPYTRSRHK